MRNLEVTIEYMRQQLLKEKIAMSIRRDNLMTEAELIAMLDVYTEFGK